MTVDLDPKPPVSIARLAEHPGVFACLVHPAGEQPDRNHQRAGVDYAADEPRRGAGGQRYVNVDHDASRLIGGGHR